MKKIKTIGKNKLRYIGQDSIPLEQGLISYSIQECGKTKGMIGNKKFRGRFKGKVKRMTISKFAKNFVKFENQPTLITHYGRAMATYIPIDLI